MKIKVYMNSLQEHHFMYMNDKKRDFILYDAKDTTFDSARFKYKVLDMVSDWPNELVNPDIIDGLEYKIIIKDDEKETSYKFQNKFPEDVYRIEELFNQVSAGVK